MLALLFRRLGRRAHSPEELALLLVYLLRFADNRARVLLQELGAKAADMYRPGLTTPMSQAIVRAAGSLPAERRLVVTEVVRAYQRVLKSAVFPLGVRVKKVWNARAEACPVCAARHGETVEMDQPFEGGAEPGWVHPNCQCFTTYVT